MVIFQGYVSLPEGKSPLIPISHHDIIIIINHY